MKNLKLKKIIFLSLILSVIFMPQAQAYIDPGTGSFVIQSIIAGLAGFLYAVKIYWKNITSFFTSRKTK